MFFSNSCFFANFRFFRLKTILKLWFTSNFRYQWIMKVDQQRCERCANFQYHYLIVSCIKVLFFTIYSYKNWDKTIKNDQKINEEDTCLHRFKILEISKMCGKLDIATCIPNNYSQHTSSVRIINRVVIYVDFFLKICEKLTIKSRLV